MIGVMNVLLLLLLLFNLFDELFDQTTVQIVFSMYCDNGTNNSFGL